MQIRAEPEKTALPICNYSQILYQFLTFTQNLKRSRKADFSSLSPIIIIEESNLQTFLHSLGSAHSCIISFFCRSYVF